MAPVFYLGPNRSFCPLEALEILAACYRCWLDGERVRVRLEKVA